jgi:hypothetical protein
MVVRELHVVGIAVDEPEARPSGDVRWEPLRPAGRVELAGMPVRERLDRDPICNRSRDTCLTRPASMPFLGVVAVAGAPARGWPGRGAGEPREGCAVRLRPAPRPRPLPQSRRRHT